MKTTPFWMVFTIRVNMGEKIRDIGKIKIGKVDFDVELNKATSTNGPRYIHIQNPKFRYCLTESDFYQFGSEILRAKKHFLWEKKGNHDE